MAQDRAKRVQIYLAPDVPSDKMVLDLWNASSKPQELFRQILRAGIRSLYETGEFPPDLIRKAKLNKHLHGAPVMGGAPAIVNYPYPAPYPGHAFPEPPEFPAPQEEQIPEVPARKTEPKSKDLAKDLSEDEGVEHPPAPAFDIAPDAVVAKPVFIDQNKRQSTNPDAIMGLMGRRKPKE